MEMDMYPFKICPKCAYTWKTRDDFLVDPSICLVGFQARFEETESGYYLFNHNLRENHCDTTLAMEVEVFLSLLTGTMFTDIKAKTPICEMHCSNVEDLSQCPVECKNAFAREIMQTFSQCNLEDALN
jgi:hypothetical protein